MPKSKAYFCLTAKTCLDLDEPSATSLPVDEDYVLNVAAFPDNLRYLSLVLHSSSVQLLVDRDELAESSLIFYFTEKE